MGLVVSAGRLKSLSLCIKVTLGHAQQVGSWTRCRHFLAHLVWRAEIESGAVVIARDAVLRWVLSMHQNDCSVYANPLFKHCELGKAAWFQATSPSLSDSSRYLPCWGGSCLTFSYLFVAVQLQYWLLPNIRATPRAKLRASSCRGDQSRARDIVTITAAATGAPAGDLPADLFIIVVVVSSGVEVQCIKMTANILVTSFTWKSYKKYKKLFLVQCTLDISIKKWVDKLSCTIVNCYETHCHMFCFVLGWGGLGSFRSVTPR